MSSSNRHIMFDSESDSDIIDSSSEDGHVSISGNRKCEYQTPKKRKYRRSLHHGLSSKRANYHKVTPEKSAEVYQYERYRSTSSSNNFSTQESFMERNEFFLARSSSPVHKYDNTSSSSLSQFSLSSSESDFSSTTFDSDSEGESFASSNVTDSDHDSLPEQRNDFSAEENSQEPLYEGCKLSEHTAYTMIMVFVHKHSLSKEAFSDLLKLISAHLPPSANFAESTYKVKEILKSTIGFQEPILHHYCEICQRYCEDGVCDNDACTRNNNRMLEFHDLRLEDQLKDMFKDDIFYNTIKREMQLQKSKTDQILYDITDGTVYKENLKSYQKHGDLYITFIMNTDGVSLFSSSKKGSLWPIYLAINELPLKLRFSRKYLIPCYLHCQVEKPNMLTYMTPLVKILQRLHSHGIKVETCDGTLRVKAHLIAASLDLPARAMVSNMKQFNGKHSCTVCCDEGETSAGNALHRYFPYRDDSVLRTKDSFSSDAKEALRRGVAVNGVKGISSLMFLNYVDQTSVFVADWMHGVLLGVTKALMRFWFDSKHRHEDFFIGHQIVLLDQRLMKIHIPDFISRKQRSLVDHAHWKASECREWLIRFSTPVLYGILAPEPYLHYLCLVTAMGLLTKYGVSLKEIDYAETLLAAFCKTFPDIYGIQSQTMNIHNLRHYAECVRMYGPLYSYSCFGFESMNSYLKNMVHGTGNANSQVCFAVGMAKQISSVLRDISDRADKKLKQLAQQLSSKIIGKGFHQEVDSYLGKTTKMQQTHKFYNLLNEEMQASGPSTFMRLQHKNTVFYCEEYQQAKTKNSYTVLFTHLNQEEKIGLVQCYILANNQTYAVIKNYHREPFSLNQEMKDSIQNAVLKQFVDKSLCSHIWITESDNRLNSVIVPTQNIRTKCVFMENFISCPSNLVEHG